MKTKIISFVSLLLVAVMLLCSCSDEIARTDEEARIVATCGDYEIYYDEVRYLTVRYKADLEAMYGDYIFQSDELGADYEALLRELVTEALLETYATLTVCESADVCIDDSATEDEVNEYVEETITMLGDKDAYVEYLADNGMSDAVFRFNAGLLSCQYRYFDVLLAELHREAYDAVMAGEGFIRTMSIFVRNDEGESLSANRAMAQTVVDAVRNGASVEDYIGTRYNQDTSGCDYYFMRGYFIEEYESAAFALAVGEVSDVVEVSDGFYVIQRMEPDLGYLAANVDTYIAMYVSCRMNDNVAQAKSSLSIEWNELGSTLDLYAIS